MKRHKTPHYSGQQNKQPIGSCIVFLNMASPRYILRFFNHSKESHKREDIIKKIIASHWNLPSIGRNKITCVIKRFLIIVEPDK
jgi:hypothetical protein